jgi:serine/threonine protein kinase
MDARRSSAAERRASLRGELELERKLGAASQAFLAVEKLAELRVVRRVGMGSFAMVMECRPREATLAAVVDRVAVKILMNYYGKETSAVTRDFRHEYAIVSRLCHRNIVRMYRVLGPVEPLPEMIQLVDEATRDLMYNPRTGQPLKTMAVVMEWFPHTLSQYLRTHGRALTPHQMLRMCWELLQALHFVKSRGWVHLDVKVVQGGD